jgi:hypothetical protein
VPLSHQMSTQNANVSVFSNLKMSVARCLGRATVGAEPPAQRSVAPDRRPLRLEAVLLKGCERWAAGPR